MLQLLLSLILSLLLSFCFWLLLSGRISSEIYFISNFVINHIHVPTCMLRSTLEIWHLSHHSLFICKYFPLCLSFGRKIIFNSTLEVAVIFKVDLKTWQVGQKLGFFTAHNIVLSLWEKPSKEMAFFHSNNFAISLLVY